MNVLLPWTRLEKKWGAETGRQEGPSRLPRGRAPGGRAGGRQALGPQKGRCELCGGRVSCGLLLKRSGCSWRPFWGLAWEWVWGEHVFLRPCGPEGWSSEGLGCECQGGARAGPPDRPKALFKGRRRSDLMSLWGCAPPFTVCNCLFEPLAASPTALCGRCHPSPVYRGERRGPAGHCLILGLPASWSPGAPARPPCPGELPGLRPGAGVDTVPCLWRG